MLKNLELPLSGPVIWRLLAFVVLAVVLVGSLVPGWVTVTPFDLPDQKHFLAYAGLGCLFVLAFGGTWRAGLVVAPVLAFVGFGVEVVQAWIPDRHFRWEDVRANAAGTVVGAVIGWLLGAVVVSGRRRVVGRGQGKTNLVGKRRGAEEM